MKTINRRAIKEAPGLTRFTHFQHLSTDQIDLENDEIRGYSVITRGEARGHGMWIDSEMLQQVNDAGEAAARGIKSRYGHPGMSGDALGTALGRTTNFRIEGDRVLADLKFFKAAHSAPGKGDLPAYIMGLADEDSEAFGASIVFERDLDAESEFFQANKDPKKGFVSPDEKNEKNLPHVRLKELRASDVVDSPAANPGGFFSEEGAEELLSQVEPLMGFVMGVEEWEEERDEGDGDTLKRELRTGEIFGINAVRVRDYVRGWMARSNLELTSRKGEEEMPPEEVKEQAVSKALTSATLLSDHPDIHAVVTEEGRKAGYEAGYKEGVEAERKRASAIIQFGVGLGSVEKAVELLQAGTAADEAFGAISQAKREGIAGAPKVGADAGAEEKSDPDDALFARAQEIEKEAKVSYLEAYKRAVKEQKGGKS